MTFQTQMNKGVLTALFSPPHGASWVWPLSEGYCQDYVQLWTLVQSKDWLVQKYSCFTDPAQTLRTIPGPGLASCTYHPLSPYLTLDIFPY